MHTFTISAFINIHNYSMCNSVRCKKVRAKRPEPCDWCKCRCKCSERFPEEILLRLVEHYHSLGDYSRQKECSVSNVKEVQSKTLTIDAEIHRKVSRPFYFTYEGIQHRACGQFFCKTVDNQIRGIQKYFEINHNQLGLGSVGDRRGRHVPPNKKKQKSGKER